MTARRLIQVLSIVGAAGLSACSDTSEQSELLTIQGGDPEQGRSLIYAYGCGTCHAIEGIRGARGRVGPHLDDYSQQRLLAGFLPNSPRYLIAWLMDPPALKAQTGMPSLGITEPEARHIASYLYSLGSRIEIYPPEPAPTLRRQEPSFPGLDRSVADPAETTPRTQRIFPNPDGNVVSPH
ncbi:MULTISPECIES: c-type cytochrome [Microvirga]|uniref:c-type cytochrome n=1 Tax=Microvirga TaxID=186650 RepID=UPI001D001603|nr:hypothetical protein [Microvirga lenta]MCB5175723.1 hypothetical protein [Microvirga lenta]